MPRNRTLQQVSIITPNKIVTVLGGIVLSVIGYLAYSYIAVLIPTKVETEVSRQFNNEVKKQIAEEINHNVTIELQKAQKNLESAIKEYSDSINGRIDGLYGLVNGKTFAPALKRGTQRNHATMMKTLPVSRELLAHARRTALTSPKEVPLLSDSDFDQLTENLLKKFRNPTLNEELWNTLLELAAYKTVVNGIQFGGAQSQSGPSEGLSLNDKNFKDRLIVGKRIVLGECGVTLHNVRFVNCTFEVAKGVNGERFLKILLTSKEPAISMKLDPPSSGYVKGACEK